MPNNNILVSILILNYNNEALIKRAIKSCLTQTYRNIEILVYDDKSTDNSINNIPKNNKIRFFQNRKLKLNIAAFDAFNGYKFLIQKANGEILCLLDSDDYFNNVKIEKIVDFFEKNKNIELLQNYLVNSNLKKISTYIRKSDIGIVSSGLSKFECLTSGLPLIVYENNINNFVFNKWIIYIFVFENYFNVFV